MRKKREYILKVLKFIDKHCSVFLKDIQRSQRFLYHGFKSTRNVKLDAYSFIGLPHIQRFPLDSPKCFQDLHDQILTDQNFKALRSNSLFCISDSLVAEYYGKVFIIFPINGFSYTWSEANRKDAFYLNRRLI